MTAGRRWDPTLFAGAAQFYEQGRSPYAEKLADAFGAALGADGSGRLLDVGCGPGSIALRVVGRYREVVGIDPDPGMIGEARRLAAERGIGNATFVQASGEELPYGLGDFDAVTFASSFHWMDRELVAATVRGMLTADGAVVQIGDVRDDDEQPGRYPRPPRDQIRALVRRYLGEERRAGQTVGFVSPSDEDDVWREAGYTGPQRVRIPDGRILDRSIDDVIAGTLSMSSSTPHLFGDRLAEFRIDLRALLTATAPQGYFSVQLPDTELKIWRPSV